MGNVYQDLGLTSIINASGRMSKLGVSVIDDEVKQTLGEAAQNYVLIDDLMVKAGAAIAKDIGCADVCVSDSASSAMVLAIAALLCKNSLYQVKHFHKCVEASKRREVILLKGHNINYGAPIDEMICLGGGIPVEVGYANESYIEDIEGAINENTLAILYVKSHHCVQKNMVDVKSVIEFANAHNIPCIVDASAEEDLSIYHSMGADIVCYSGAKAISGPTSGFAACKTNKLANHMRLQYKGIGRAMKIGKENIMGLVKAISIYQKHHGYKSVVTNNDLLNFMEKVNNVDGLHAAIIQDESGREIYRCRIQVLQDYGYNAVELVECLEQYTPAIYTRNYQANLGYIAVDPRGMKHKNELHTIYEALKHYQTEERGCNEID